VHLVDVERMPNRPNRRLQRLPSDHEKRIRFFTGLFIFIIILLTVGLFLLINLDQFFTY
jgi:hypothetical protein